MEILFIAILFSVSISMFVFHFGTQSLETRLLTKRIRSVNQTPTSKAAKNKTIYKSNKKEGELSRKMKEIRSAMSPAQFSLFIGGWICAASYVFFMMALPLFNKLLLAIIPGVVAGRVIVIMTKRNRVTKLKQELPGAMDLIVICLEAGVSINAAFLRVANELGEDSPLGKELRYTFNEVNAGIPLDVALKNFSKRTNVEDINVVVAAIVQAQKLGSALALTFRVQANSLREKYRLRLKEEIQKVPIKILFPLVFFIFPTLLLVILGPAMIQIMKTFKGQGLS